MNAKIVLAGLIALMMCGATFTAQGQTWDISATAADNVTATLADGTLTISGTGAMQDFAYQSEPWYSAVTSITSVQIGDGVTYIGIFAFADCSSLTSITIPNSVTSIGSSSFPNCSSLTSIVIPSSVTSFGNWVFSYCSSLTSVTCLSTNPSAITMGVSVFDTVDKNACVLYVPASSTSLYRAADQWKDFAKIQELQIWQIGSPNLVDVTATLASGTLTISGHGNMKDFAYQSEPWYSAVTSITSVQIGDGVTYIGIFAFADCSSLTSITIPNSVTSIGSSSFPNCSSLTSIVIPSSVTSFGNWVFSYCSSLTSVTCLSTIPSAITMGVSVFDTVDKNACVLYVPVGSTSLYRAADQWKDFTHIMEPQTWNIGTPVATSVTATLFNGTLTISGKGQMQDFPWGKPVWDNVSNNITSLKIEQGVTSIGNSAFMDCSKIAGNVTIPNSVTSIGDDAFQSCSGITSINVPNSVTSIGSIAFIYCTSLPAINVDAANPNYCSDAGLLLNKNKTQLICCPAGKTGTCNIPNSVSSIIYDAFADCSSLTSVTIPASILSIEQTAFMRCNGLTSIICLNPNPSNISMGLSVFSGIDKTTCVLNVPAGSVSLYQAANQWKDFTHINGIGTAIKAVEASDLNIYSQAGNVIVESKALAIKSVSVYNLSGQLLKTVESGRNHVSIPQSFGHSILIVKVIVTDGTIVTRKIVL